MMSEEQFGGLLKFTSELLTTDPEAIALIEKAGLTQDQLRVISILVATSIRAYDALQAGGEFVNR